MLRGNLSSRPFYNERLASAAIALIGAVAIALTAFNGYKLYALSKQRSELKARIDRDLAQAQQIERGAVTLQRNVDRATLVLLAGSTQEANFLIDQRTFSWTVFLGLIETKMPFDLRLVAVAPRIEKGAIRMSMTVVGKRLEDIDDFVEALHSSGSFYDLLARNKERNEDDNTFRGEVVGYYLAPNQTAPIKRPQRPAKAIGKGRP
jgi:hypothetical protein